MRAWFFAVLASLSLLFGCASTEHSVITAAQVVDELARRGDDIDAIAVSACHAAELKAADLPDLGKATQAVESIRAACDEAFEAVDVLKGAVEHVDEVFAAVERKEADVQGLISAAIAARQAFGAAKAANDKLRGILKEW